MGSAREKMIAARPVSPTDLRTNEVHSAALLRQARRVKQTHLNAGEGDYSRVTTLTEFDDRYSEFV